MFLYTDFVGAPDALTWAQMKEMTASGLIDLQPHSKTHSNLTVRHNGEHDGRYRERVAARWRPRRRDPAQLGQTSVAVRVSLRRRQRHRRRRASRRGVKLGVTVTPGGNAFFTPPYMLRRTMIFGGDDMDAFRTALQTFRDVNLR